MNLDYLNLLLKKFPGIASGRKNFDYFESRIKKNILLAANYKKKKKKIKSNNLYKSC